MVFVMEIFGAWSHMALRLQALVVLVVTLAIVTKLLLRRGRAKLPPGPTPMPLIGNLHQMGGLLHQRLWHMAEKKFGPIMYLRMGSHPLVIVSTAAAAEEFVRVQDKVWASRPQNLADKIFTNDFKDIVLAPYGDHWRHMRKICTLELFTHKRIESFREYRTDEFRIMMRSVYEDYIAGRPADLTVKLGHLATNTVTRMLVGKRFFGTDQAEEAARFKDLVFTLFSVSNTPTIGDFIPWLRWVSYASGYMRYVKKVKATSDAYLQEFLDVKKNGAMITDDANRTQDFVDILLAQPSESGEGNLDDDTIKAVLQDLLLAGTDNSSITTEWAISELLRHPHAMSKLQAELDAVVGTTSGRIVTETDIPDLPYLQAVVKETFRLHPTTPLNIPHESTKSTSVWGYELPAGTKLLVNFYAIHRDPKVWDRPLEFDPERFVCHPEIDVRGNCYGLIPFGSGRRQCPGLHLGILFVQMGVARLVQGFEFELPDGKDGTEVDMSEIFGGTTPRKVPLAVVAKPRLPAHLY